MTIEDLHPPGSAPGSTEELSAACALAAVGEQRFSRLDDFARRRLAYVEWVDRLHELGLMRQVLLEALEVNIRSFRQDWGAIFDPFVGSWVGGDLHRAKRAFQHIWSPTRIDADGVAIQQVHMFDGSTWTHGCNVCRRATPQIVGLVGDKAHVGYPLPDRALLWLGEVDAGRISLHVERVWANGQLYDVRGLVIEAEGGRLHRQPIPSDWRYHRVDDGAISVAKEE